MHRFAAFRRTGRARFCLGLGVGLCLGLGLLALLLAFGSQPAAARPDAGERVQIAGLDVAVWLPLPPALEHAHDRVATVRIAPYPPGAGRLTPSRPSCIPHFAALRMGGRVV